MRKKVVILMILTILLQNGFSYADLELNISNYKTTCNQTNILLYMYECMMTDVHYIKIRMHVSAHIT